MTAEPELRSGRRTRVILLGASLGDPPVEKALREAALELRADFHLCQSSVELLSRVERAGDALCLVVLEHSFPELVSTARLTHQKVPLSELVLLATEEQQAKVKAQLGLSPRLGSHWQFASPSMSGLGKVLRTAYKRADQRRATRTTLDRFNARLSVPAETVDTQELRQLVISDRFLSSILESAFDAVILVDRTGGVAAFNPSSERLFERTQQQVLSRPVTALSAGSWANDLQAAFRPHQQGQLIQSSVETENGSRSVEISATPVYDRSHNLLATSLIIRDVTTRLQSEQALRTNEKLAMVGRLASTIAHEINNPLEAVTNLVYLARHSSNSAEVQHYQKQADHELQRMSAITNQTLHFHKQATRPGLFSCEDLFASVIGVYQGRFLNSQIELQARWRAKRPISCFEGEIRQVLNNLVGNATDAMQATGGRLLLRSREATNWKAGDKGVVITVADTGGGMSPKTLKKVFDAFFTTKGAGGTGLGLWISHEIIQRHRGTIRIRSSQRENDSGTVFAIFLPYEAPVR